MKIKTKTLMKPLGEETGLVLGDGAIRVSFNLKNPFAANNILRRRRRDEFLRFVVKKCSKLIRHSLSPFNIF